VDGSRPDDVVALLIAPLLGAAAAMLRLRWLLPLPLSSVLRGHEGRIMTPEEGRQTIRAELTAGLQLTKCQQCGCMQEALDELTACVSTAHTAEADALARDLQAWRAQMQPTRYACLGCAYCYPAVAHNALASALPYISPLPTLQCDFQMHNAQWPPVVGEYLVLDPRASIAVSTLASTACAEALAHHHPPGLAIVGKTETETIGIDKIVKNVITSPTLRYLIVAGVDPQGHLPGQTLLALAENGVDDKGRFLGAPGKRPILRNVSTPEIQAFRAQVHVIDMMGCENLEEMSARIATLSQQVIMSCGCKQRAEQSPVSISTAPRIVATDPHAVVKMDKAGYFVIVPLGGRGMISVEHYAYDHTLLRVIEGTNARALYSTIINNGWVTELSHAAYLGKELARAEFACQHGVKYVQDGA